MKNLIKQIKTNDIKSINKKIKLKKIKKGFTNQIYKIKYKNNYYKVRITNNNPFINRKLEWYIETKINQNDFIYYDSKNYDYIRKWIKGKNLKKYQIKSVWEKIIQKINHLHSLKIDNEIKVSLPVYELDIEIHKNLKKPLELYKQLIKQIINPEDCVLSHNDISLDNLIIYKKEIYLIDYEWCSYNHKYWDIANFIKDLNYKFKKLNKINILKKQYDFKLLLKIIFCVHFYSFFWTYKEHETKKILHYRNLMKKKILYWFKILNETKK